VPGNSGASGIARSAANEYAPIWVAEMMAGMSSGWKKVADVAIGGLTEVGFVPGGTLLLVVSHQGRGAVDLASGRRVARDRQEMGSWFDAARPAALGIGPVHGQQIEIAGLAGGQLPVVTADGWRARRSARGVTLAGRPERRWRWMRRSRYAPSASR